MTKKNNDKKIVSIGYTDRGFFHHPETKRDFKWLMIKLAEAYKNKDLKSCMLYTMQLLPDKIACEDKEIKNK